MFAHNQILHPYLAAEVQQRFHESRRRGPVVPRRRRRWRLALPRVLGRRARVAGHP